jgi:hypothetical protein
VGANPLLPFESLQLPNDQRNNEAHQRTIIGNVEDQSGDVVEILQKHLSIDHPRVILDIQRQTIAEGKKFGLILLTMMTRVMYLILVIVSLAWADKSTTLARLLNIVVMTC